MGRQEYTLLETRYTAMQQHLLPKLQTTKKERPDKPCKLGAHQISKLKLCITPANALPRSHLVSAKIELPRPFRTHGTRMPFEASALQDTTETVR